MVRINADDGWRHACVQNSVIRTAPRRQSRNVFEEPVRTSRTVTKTHTKVGIYFRQEVGTRQLEFIFRRKRERSFQVVDCIVQTPKGCRIHDFRAFNIPILEVVAIGRTVGHGVKKGSQQLCAIGKTFVHHKL